MTNQASPLTIDDITIVDQSKLKKAVTAAALGNTMEWFDFGVYGFVAFALGKVFFPEVSPAIQTIAALATFSVPFLIRPLGGLFFGIMGDRFGRQKVLSLTIIIMAASTFCIGLIPGYNSIGILAPILLLLCKLAQGFSVGGEYTGAAIFVAEYAPDRQRGVLGSWLDFGSIAGFVLGAGFVVLLQTFLSEAAFLSWGWRVPFLVAAPLGLIGLYLRHAAEETPAFTQQLERLEQEDKSALQERPTVPFTEIFTKYRRSLLVCIGMVLVTNITYYMLLTYMPTYLSSNLGYSENHGVMIIIAVMIGMLFVQPLIGFTSDRIGRRPFILIGSIALFVVAIPAFLMIASNETAQIFLGLLLLAIALNCMIGVMAATLPALFPARIRYSALASSFNIAIIAAGLTPTLAAWLVASSNNLLMPAYYLMGAAVIGIVTSVFLPETANQPLRGDTPNASNPAEAQVLLQESYDIIEERIEDIDVEITTLQAKIAQLSAQREKLADRHPNID
ncbi:glycine betaine/L-proline transporter ProP [Brucella anthropi]|uniref:glycine betaine/L-proline transporter ProP n=1 Tax=Brucella anthropi TaxID=529 RepID=UPI00384F9B9D